MFRPEQQGERRTRFEREARREQEGGREGIRRRELERLTRNVDEADFRNDGGEDGQLGNGKRERSNLPSKVIAPSGGGRWEKVFATAGGGPDSGAHTCALRNDRTLGCWGKNDNGQLGLGFTSMNGVVTPRRVCFPAP